MSPVKQAIIDWVQGLPEECIWDDLMYRIYARQKIEAGLREIEEGRVIDHEDVFKEWQD